MWNDACKLEMEGLKNAQVYKLVDRPSGVKCIPLVWVFKIKQPKNWRDNWEIQGSLLSVGQHHGPFRVELLFSNTKAILV
jgi:hypothetical protein